MRNTLKILGKLLIIGILTTIVRIVGQMLIPVGIQTVLKPSLFVENGTMPLAFTIYGIFAYGIIASLFLLVKDKIAGNRVLRGVKFGASCSLIWVVYLLEPLPHVAFIDKFTYPIADSIALLVLGALSGFLLCEKVCKEHKSVLSIRLKSVLAITVAFVIGRIIQYCVIDIYSDFHNNKIESIIWSIVVGLVLSLILQWLNTKVTSKNLFYRVIIVGVILFGVDLLLFNFFMPLVFSVDILDLFVRTFVDLLFVTIGCFSLEKN